MNRTTAELREVAAEFGTAAIARLAAMAGLTGPGAESEQTQLGALRELLDRGFGRPPQAITADPANTPTLHLIAATAVSQELVAALDERRTINSHIEPINGHADGEILLMQPLPLE